MKWMRGYRHQVGLELGHVHVERAVKAQRGRQRADHLRDQPARQVSHHKGVSQPGSCAIRLLHSSQSLPTQTCGSLAELRVLMPSHSSWPASSKQRFGVPYRWNIWLCLQGSEARPAGLGHTIPCEAGSSRPSSWVLHLPQVQGRQNVAGISQGAARARLLRLV